MENIITEFQNIPTTAISDVLDGLNNLNSAIKPLQEHYRFAGRALTVQLPINDNRAVLKAIGAAQPGDVLIVDSKGDTYRAIAGDFVVGLMKTMGIRALVVDGVIRDIVAIKELDFPVFSRGTTVASSGKAGVGDINVPISCGGVAVYPGDIIVGDADGVVVVAQKDAEEVLKKAKEKVAKDQVREDTIAGKPEEIKKYIAQMLAK
ncbi:RraA family protein [Peribacillus asahii]|uniref:RraA family protein n=1 Tax=Peribacillus asahii TaxID=228899 RepID=UPI0020793B1A|nr:RraA family protein [Peribacillus asahii]USK59418.1 RraA family protein [Peribacillus asahii]